MRLIIAFRTTLIHAYAISYIHINHLFVIIICYQRTLFSWEDSFDMFSFSEKHPTTTTSMNYSFSSLSSSSSFCLACPTMTTTERSIIVLFEHAAWAIWWCTIDLMMPDWSRSFPCPATSISLCICLLLFWRAKMRKHTLSLFIIFHYFSLFVRSRATMPYCHYLLFIVH